jgi:hypothetical protein
MNFLASKKKKEQKELLNEALGGSDDSFNQLRRNKLDLRVIRVFGNLFSDDVYDKVGQIFPNRVDTMSQRHTKIYALVQNHDQQKDVFFLRHGSKLLSGLCGITALYTLNHFRTFLKLRHYARIAMYGTTIFFPCFFTAAVHDLAIAHRMVTKEETCASCTGVRSGLYQSFFSIGYVYFTTALLGLYHASAYSTIPLPYDFLWHRPNMRRAFEVAREISAKNKFSIIFMGFFFLNMIAGYGVGYTEQQEMLGLYGTLLRREQLRMEQARSSQNK